MGLAERGERDEILAVKYKYSVFLKEHFSSQSGRRFYSLQ